MSKLGCITGQNEAELLQVIKENPNNKNAIYFGAALLLEAGRRHDALTWYQTLLELDAHYPGLCRKLGSMYEDTQEYGQAIHYYAMALDAEPELQDSIHLKLGHLYVMMNDNDMACAHYRKVFYPEQT